MTVAVAQTATNRASSGSSIAATFPSGTPATGSLVVVGVCYDASQISPWPTKVTSITLTGVTFVQRSVYGDSWQQGEIWYGVKGGISTGTVVTVNLDASYTDLNLVCVEFSATEAGQYVGPDGSGTGSSQTTNADLWTAGSALVPTQPKTLALMLGSIESGTDAGSFVDPPNRPGGGTSSWGKAVEDVPASAGIGVGLWWHEQPPLDPSPGEQVHVSHDSTNSFNTAVLVELIGTKTLSLEPLSAQSVFNTATLINPLEIDEVVTIGADGAGTTVVPENGARELILTGNFETGVPYRVHAGRTGTSSDALCYAGPNKGFDVLSPTGSTLTAYLPTDLPAGEAISIYVQRRDISTDNDLVVDALRIVNRDYSSSLWSMKALFPPNRRMGPRNMALLSEPPKPTNYLLQSELRAISPWTPGSTTNAVITDGEIDPFGTSRGSLVHEDTTLADAHGIDQQWTAEARLYTLSIYAKAVNRPLIHFSGLGVGQTFDLENGVLGTFKLEFLNTLLFASIESAEHFGEAGWYRCVIGARSPNPGSASFTCVAAASDDLAGLSFDGLDQDTFRVAFPAIDAWCVARMYRPTTTEAVT